MAEEKIYTVQPRFRIGDPVTGWAMVEGIFKMGEGIPSYGTDIRDTYLAFSWQTEPMTAGVFSTWVEKAQTVDWKVTGGKVNSNYYARLYHNANNGDGWTAHIGMGAQDYLATDKGFMEELGRESLTPEILHQLQKYYRDMAYYNKADDMEVAIQGLTQLIDKTTTGRVSAIQHLDSTRLIRVGLPGLRWRYYPDGGTPVAIPDDNLVQVQSMPSSRDRFRGYGYCAMTRLIDAKNLMLGYLTYFRQEVGDLPPELILIINGLPEDMVRDSLSKYRADREAAGHDLYSKVWWLGSDDPMTPVSVTTQSLVSPSKAFNYQTMLEWWIKLLSLNVGEDVGEFWLLQKGESKTVQSIQADKSRGKGVAKFLMEKERKYNMNVMPFGTRFQFDNANDDADAQRADIMGTNITNLKNLASVGVDRQEPLYTLEELKDFAKSWDIVAEGIEDEEVPVVMGAMVKELYDSDRWVVKSDMTSYRLSPPLKNGEAAAAEFVYETLKDLYLGGYARVDEPEVVM